MEQNNLPTRVQKPRLLDLTVTRTINDYVATGTFGHVYKCSWRRPSSGPVKVTVKVIKDTAEEGLKGLRQVARTWARLEHENIVPLFGTTKDFGSSLALVSLWFPHGTLLRLIASQGAGMNTRSKLNLLHDIASGLHYLHSFPIIHGDITSSNILVDFKEGEYKASLTDLGLSTVLGGLSDDCTVEGSTVRCRAIRWSAPELFRLAHSHHTAIKPTKQTDMYSFGRVMFHVLTLLIPWDGVEDNRVLGKILNGEKISRPEILHTTTDVTDTRWNEIELCWSADASARPSTSAIMAFLKSELEALARLTPVMQGLSFSLLQDVLVAEVQDSRQRASLGKVDAEQKIASDPPRCPSPIKTVYLPHKTNESILSLISIGHELQHQTETMNSSRTTLVGPPSPQESCSSNTITLHSTATASSLSLSGAFNVLIFGDTGVGKSSVINLIMGRDIAKTSADAPTCTLQHISYGISFDNHHFKLWEVSSTAPRNFFQRLFARWRLKKAYNKIYKDDGVYLLLYCMRNSRAKTSLVKDYKFFTSIVDSTASCVPVAAVVTCLEDYPSDMDDWWENNEQNLKDHGMQFSKHACITALPDDLADASPFLSARRCRSQQIIRKLIYDSYEVGRAPVKLIPSHES